MLVNHLFVIILDTRSRSSYWDHVFEIIILLLILFSFVHQFNLIISFAYNVWYVITHVN